MLEGKAVIGETDMLQTMQKVALDLAAKALDFFDVTEATEIARFIKKEFDGKYGSGWQCIVGTDFGALPLQQLRQTSLLQKSQSECAQDYLPLVYPSNIVFFLPEVIPGFVLVKSVVYRKVVLDLASKALCLSDVTEASRLPESCAS
ncbi:hypothetical protein V6N13_117678 [Hibiscus sabdariffa]